MLNSQLPTSHSQARDHHVDGRIATATFDGVSINVDPLQSYDIGAVGVAGTTTLGTAGTTIEGSGADIRGTADAFRYYARPVTDDSSITVQVKSIENTPAIGRRPQQQCG
jgi:hypothetical protein